MKFSLKPFKCNDASNQSVLRFSINVTGLASLKRKRGLEAELVNHNIQDSFLLHEESSNRKQSKKVEHLFEIIISLVIRTVIVQLLHRSSFSLSLNFTEWRKYGRCCKVISYPDSNRQPLD